MQRNESGFTLIELLIVVVIIGILASIAIPKFSATREKAYRASLSADLRNLANLEEVYYDTYFTYATNTDAVGLTPTAGVTITFGEGTTRGWSALATHIALASTDGCAIFHGNAAPLAPATTSSTVQCAR